MLKSEIRKLYKDRRGKLSESQYTLLNEQITHIFRKSFLPLLSNLHVLHYFIPSATKHEPDVIPLVEIICQQFPGIIRMVPGKMNESGGFDNVIVSQHTKWKENKWGIAEPVNGETGAPDAIDVLIAPLIAFDLHGNRVGYGKGYYDRLLRLCREDCIKLGVSFFDPIDHIDDIQPHDIALDFCITPDQCYVF